MKYERHDGHRSQSVSPRALMNFQACRACTEGVPQAGQLDVTGGLTGALLDNTADIETLDPQIRGKTILNN